MKRVHLLTIVSFIIGCLMVFAGCKKPALDAPVGLTVNETTLDLTWSEVEGAEGYTVKINGVENKTKQTIWPLDALEEGTYQIYVKAVSVEDGVDDSDWSDVYVFERAAESGLMYSLTNNNTEYQLTGIGTAKGDIVIADTYRGKPVTKISDMALANGGKDVTSVVVGENVTSIGTRAFYNCTMMTSITFKAPEKILTMGAYAFQGCRSLTSIAIPENITSISNYQFAYCRSLETVTFGSKITSIGEHSFADCDKLNNVVIPDTVTSIGAYAFANNIGMTNVKIGDGVQSIGEYAFLSCTALENVTFGTSLETIAKYAFSTCSALKAIALPDSLAIIYDSAFYGCENLETVDFGSNLADLGGNVFGNTKLTSAEKGLVIVDGWVVSYKGETSSDDTVNVPIGVVGIADKAFYGTQYMVNLTLPDTVQ